MGQTDRIYHIHHTLARRRTPIPLRQLAEQLEVSEATVKPAGAKENGFNRLLAGASGICIVSEGASRVG